MDDKERKKMFPSLSRVRNQKEYEERLALYQSVLNQQINTLKDTRSREIWNDPSCYDLIIGGSKEIKENFENCIKYLQEQWTQYTKILKEE